MKWQGRRTSTNVNDIRGKGGSGRSMGVPGASLMQGGLGGIVIMLILYFLIGGNSLGQIGLNQLGYENSTTVSNKAHDEYAEFFGVILASTEDVWEVKFREEGLTYRNPQLTIFSGAVNSRCGYQSSQVGPFYCSADETIYMDMGFFDELATKYQAAGDFAMAYVLAHEVGHHVQHLLGILGQVNQARAQVNRTLGNQYLVALELQADYFAGLWAHHAKDMLEYGDLEEGLNAAQAIGDDTLQKKSQGYVVPENFTHGTSEQRRSWLLKGFEKGTLEDGNTFTQFSR